MYQRGFTTPSSGQQYPGGMHAQAPLVWSPDDLEDDVDSRSTPYEAGYEHSSPPETRSVAVGSFRKFSSASHGRGSFSQDYGPSQIQLRYEAQNSHSLGTSMGLGRRASPASDRELSSALSDAHGQGHRRVPHTPIGTVGNPDERFFQSDVPLDEWGESNDHYLRGTGGSSAATFRQEYPTATSLEQQLFVQDMDVPGNIPLEALPRDPWLACVLGGGTQVRRGGQVRTDTIVSGLENGYQTPSNIDQRNLSPSDQLVGGSASDAYSSAPGFSICDCGIEFSGKYRHGNLARHKRRKHDPSAQVYHCSDPHCNKVFQRSDARLKHYRSRHPELAHSPVSRKQRAPYNTQHQSEHSLDTSTQLF